MPLKWKWNFHASTLHRFFLHHDCHQHDDTNEALCRRTSFYGSTTSHKNCAREERSRNDGEEDAQRTDSEIKQKGGNCKSCWRAFPCWPFEINHDNHRETFGSPLKEEEMKKFRVFEKVWDHSRMESRGFSRFWRKSCFEVFREYGEMWRPSRTTPHVSPRTTQFEIPLKNSPRA